MKISRLIIYPIKSIGGVDIKSSYCDQEGLQYDRRMMLVNDDGLFITQREHPRMALIGSEIDKEGFVFFVKNNPENKIFIPHNTPLFDSKHVQVWRHRFTARSMEKEYSNWFSKYLETPCTLVKMDDNSERYKSLKKAPSKTLLSMADGYPYLFLSEASLNDLNNKMAESLPMDRFRPNIVLTDSIEYEEESLDKFHINELRWRMIKPCARCIMTTINQKTAKKLVEPLKTLSTYKKVGNKIYFGMNAVNLDRGWIKIGNEIEV